MEALKLLSTTVVLTLLIWIGADELLTVTAEVNVTIQVVPASQGSKMIVRMADTAPQRFLVQVSGPRRIVTQVADAAPIKVTLQVDDRPPSQGVTLGNLAELLRRNRRPFKDLMIESVQPDSLDVVVDRWTTHRVALIVKKPLQLPYTVEPRLEPAHVDVRTSLLRLARMGSDGGTIEIDVKSSLEGRPTDTSLSVTLPVPVSKFGEGATAVPRTVQVLAMLSAVKPRRMTIPTVPIHLATSFASLGLYRTDLGGGQPLFVTQTIEVTGSDQALDALDPDNTGIIGVISLTEPDYENPGRLLVKVPVFILPSGIKLAGNPEPVQFKLVPTNPSP